KKKKKKKKKKKSWLITFIEIISSFVYELISRLMNEETCYIAPHIFPLSYLMFALNLILAKGLATVSLQYFDMDYPTYAVCRNSKLVFVMLLSVFWLHKKYHMDDWVVVFCVSASLFCFRAGAHDVWFSKANTMGVPMLLLASFLSAIDHNWKEKIMRRQGATPNEVLFHINLIGVVMLFVFIVASGELQSGIQFMWEENQSALWWMICRGVTYAFWIHYSVVLIQQAGALVNQYVSTIRKIVSVMLSFLVYRTHFHFYHGIERLCNFQ
ncbi:Drug/Metabolite transporter superfamily, partial [Reticulomyxa filosa]